MNQVSKDMSGEEDHKIDCELLLRLWQESGIVHANHSRRIRKWKEIAWKYNSEMAPAADPVDIQALQNEWHDMITRRGSKFLQKELKNDPAPRRVRTILKDVNNRLERQVSSPESTAAASACSTTKTLHEMVFDGLRRHKDGGVENESLKRQKTTDDETIHQDDQNSIHPKEAMLRDASEIRKEAAEKERLLNETLLKAAEVELEGKREFWRTKNMIAKEELERATAEKEAALARRIAALLNRNAAIAEHNRVSGGKKITLPSPPDMYE